MMTRIISGIVGIGVFLALCFLGSLPFAIAVGALTAVAIHEFVGAERSAPVVTDIPAWARGLARVMAPINAPLGMIGLCLIPIGYLLATADDPLPARIYAGLLALGVAFGVGIVIRSWNTGEGLGWFRAFYGKIGFWYLGGLFSSFLLLRGISGTLVVGSFGRADRGAWYMLWVAVCVWSTDTFAYFVGRAVGKHKLAPKLSPAKTIEGALGGFAGAIAAGALFGHWIGVPYAVGAAIGGIAGVLGPIGDLFESALKRELGLKDFGKLMPGHGGALDRFDSLLFVAPAAYLYIKLVAGM